MLRRTLGWSGLALLLCWLWVTPLLAQDIPAPLQSWQGWVLHDVPQHGCPFIANQMPGSDSYQCAWPGRLTLDVSKDGGHFDLSVHVDAPSWVALPGDSKAWPQQVTSNKQAATVLQRDGVPVLWLTPGDYQLSGVLPWTVRPAQLRVPASIGLVSLHVDGAAVTRIERDGDELTLGEAAAAQRSADALSLRVYRHLADGLPAMLQTQLQLNVTGSSREQVLGPVLPNGFVATALSGALPVRLESDGRLRVQLRPGQWTITVSARSVAPLTAVNLKLPAAPWPQQEIWSYADDTDLRGTRVEGSAIDASQAGVPSEWSDLPAYALNDSHGLTIAQGNRGDEGGQGDQVQVQRELWLDFDGAGLSVADHLTGVLRHQQRLDVAAPWQLQRATQGDEPQLITKGSDGRTGIELRDQQLDLSAGLRLAEHAGAIPTDAWQLPLEGIHATLHLPAGYRLLGTVGVDHSPDSWVGQWSLLDLFVVALIALLAGRLLGWPWALLAAGYLVLAQHQNDAPLWTLAITLALALLLRALPSGRLQSTARNSARLVLGLTVLWTLPFAATQLQYALHPQLENSHSDRVVSVEFMAPPPKIIQQVAPPPAPPPPPPPAVAEVSANAVQAPSPAVMALPTINTDKVQRSTAITAGTIARYPVARGASSVSAQASESIESHQLIQAGTGTPHWNEGNNYRLDWAGPVTAAQSMRLVIAPMWLVRLLRLGMVVLLGVLLAKLALSLLPGRSRWPNWRRGGAAGAALLAFAWLPHAAHAQSLPGHAAPSQAMAIQSLPSQTLLDQLRNRLLEAPKCAPNCAVLAQAQWQVNGDSLDVTLEADVGTSVALPLPSHDDALQLLDVSVDGHANATLVRSNDQLLLRLDRGVHQIGLRYRIGNTDTVSLHFGLRPQHVSFAGQGWALDGVDDGRALGDSLAMHRLRSASDGKNLPPVQSFPPYVRLTRELTLGVDWSVQNTVERIAPQHGGFSITLPLLPGEHPLGDGVLVKNGRISITFNANSDEVRWTSRLDQTPRLQLKAPALGERAETWEIDATPMWHVDATGVPTSADEDELRYEPLPGETLQLVLSKPVAVSGDSLAFDSVSASTAVGERAMETTLGLHARSTRGGEHVIDLPAGAELLGATRDNAPLSLALRDGKLSLPILPDEHDYSLRLREPRGVSLNVRTPTFALHAPVANITTTLILPQSRWVLWTWGPTMGPAVLYWSQLIVLLLAAWLLARYAPTPLRFRHWLLLGLGFSAFAWSAYVLVVLWLILLGLRAQGIPTERFSTRQFNLLQSGLVALSLLALMMLISAIPTGLLGVPDMHVAGNSSSAWNLRWFADQSANALPDAGVISVPLWVYKLAMLAWALWLANALIGWLRWAFDAWTRDGYWRKPEPKAAAIPPQLPPSGPGAPHG